MKERCGGGKAEGTRLHDSPKYIVFTVCSMHGLLFLGTNLVADRLAATGERLVVRSHDHCIQPIQTPKQDTPRGVLCR
jgi:hypothetical protein